MIGSEVSVLKSFVGRRQPVLPRCEVREGKMASLVCRQFAALVLGNIEQGDFRSLSSDSATVEQACSNIRHLRRRRAREQHLDLVT